MGGVLALVTKATVTRMRSAWARVSMFPDDSVYLSSAVPSARCFVLCPCSLANGRGEGRGIFVGSWQLGWQLAVGDEAIPPAGSASLAVSGFNGVCNDQGLAGETNGHRP